jgi:polysaccharide export outer membrane protein
MADKFDTTPKGALLLVAALVAALVAGCVDLPPDYPYHKEPNPLEREYELGVSDTIEINVWKRGEFGTGGPIRPDGTITMPLVGDLKAAGKTPTQLRDDIRQRLSDYIKLDEVVVTVSVTGINSYFVTVIGSVESPGNFVSKKYLTVTEAVALAGGPNRFTSGSDAYILRIARSGGVRRIPINWAQLKRGVFLQQNIYLMRGDRIVFP